MLLPRQIKPGVSQVLLTVLLLALLSVSVHADGFLIRQAKAVFNKSSLTVNARFDLEFSEAIEEALHNGVNISLTIKLDLFKNRRYRWDEHIAQWAFDRGVSYHSLTNRYVLSSSSKNERQSFSSLNDLFDEIESFSFQSDIQSDTLPKSKHGYKLQLQVVLDKSALPSPLRVMAHVLPAWRQKSDVHEWFIDG